MRLRMSAAVPALLAAAALTACSDGGEPVNDAVNPDQNAEATLPNQAEGANSFTEEQARDHVAEAGFADVSPLAKSDDGLWQGTATRGQETVNVSVDYRGAVTTSPEGAPMPAAAGETAQAADDQASPASATVSDNPAAMPGATSAEMRQTGERG